MKRNFVVSLFGSFIGFGMLLILLSATGIVGARGADVSRSARSVSHINSAAAATLTSTFTYKGQLISNGSPVSNTCDFQFSLYDALNAGTRIGITQTVSSVSVSRGLFTALLNVGNEFGDTAFNGDARWLSIGVRCPAGSGVYTSLSPRQPLTSLPFALPGLRTFPNASSPNIVGGFSGNSITGGAVGSIIGGGGASGEVNTITNSWAFIGGGANNIVRGLLSTISGGGNNQANADFTMVGGGYSNTAAGQYSSVPGGRNNLAQGDYSFAAGRRAQANHAGAFVWADSTDADFASTGSDQFLIRAGGFVGINTNAPSRDLTISSNSSFVTGIDLFNTTTVSGTNGYRLQVVGSSEPTRAGNLEVWGVSTGHNYMTIQPGGNVGIGTTAPSSLLNVRTTAAGYGMLRVINPIFTGEASIGYRNDGDTDTASWVVGKNVGGATDGSFAWYNNGTKMTLLNNGNVGIGTTSPASLLNVRTTAAGYGMLRVINPTTNGEASIGYRDDSNADAASWVVGKNAGGVTDGFAWYYNGTKMILRNDGRVGIGTTTPFAKLNVKGEDTNAETVALRVSNSAEEAGLTVYDNGAVIIGGSLALGTLDGSSTTHACYAGNYYFAACSSAAEYVPTIDDGLGFAQAADLVSIAPSVKNPYGDEHAPFVVTKSNKPCDDNLLGFIVNPESGADGKKLNDHYLPLAIYGYFPAKVTMENGAIKRGDPITSSSRPGYGMKATQACKIIGYALEDADHEGVIQVFANHGESTAPAVTSLQAQVQELKDQNTALDARLTALEQTMSGQTPAPSTPSGNVVVLGALLVVGIVVGRRVDKRGLQ